MTVKAEKVDPQNRINGLTNKEIAKRTSSVKVNLETKKMYYQKAPVLRKMRAGLLAQKGQTDVKEVFGTVVEPSAFYPRNNPTDLDFKHPAPFDEREIIDHTELLSKPGDWVFDPFLGSGTTLTACVKTGRKGAGVELMPQWIEVAKKKLNWSLAALTEMVSPIFVSLKETALKLWRMFFREK